MNDDDIEILDIFNKDKNTEEPLSRVARLEKRQQLMEDGKEEYISLKDEKRKVKIIDNSQPKVETSMFDKVNAKKEEEKTMKKKKSKKKMGNIQKSFCIISALFILGCIGFYGYRFVKYYRIYNPKVDSSDGSVLLAKDIVGKSEFATDNEDGLFSSSGNYVYKGMVKDNYLKYNNMLWRIVRINADNSIDIILDDYITLLPWSSSVSEFTKSDIYEYLNKNFLDNLDKDMLVKTSFCTDKIDDLTNITCEGQDIDSYVKLLDVTNFLNSVNNSKSYLVSAEEIFWLSDYGTDKIWHTNGTNVSQSEVTSFYEVRPMVRLKNTTVYSSGEGSVEKPFMVGSEGKIKLGSKVVLGEDNWIVYDITSDIKLMREEVIKKQSDFDKEKITYEDSSLMKYLNEEYLNSLSYKDMLVETTWETGAYKTSVKDIKETTVKTKVGIPNILDIKFDSKVNGYFTSTSQEEHIFVYENPLRPSRNTTYRSIRPCIAISKDNANKLKYSNGVFKVGE